jgi:hypothetical protein
MQPDVTIATWWGLAEGDRTIVGVVVVAVAVLAVAFVISRVLRGEGRRRKRS